MKTFLKYLTTSTEDVNWGIYLNTAGSFTIPPETEYPPTEHPSGYYFTWEQGRELQEYQLNYITEGEGIFENKTGSFPVKAGSLLVISPGIWHRYKPDFHTGWTENYIGFGGQAAESFMQHRLFSPDKPVIQVGEREEILDSFLKIFDLMETEQPGFQHIASGLIIKLLGYLVAFEKQKEFSGKKIAGVLAEARYQMRSEVGRNFDLEKFAADNNIGYSWFRRMFKSIHYFSRMFKQKTGKSPSEFRG
jgi:hypothetical protein